MGISIPQLLIILAILLLLFGTKRLRNIGGDLGDAIKGFRKAVGDDQDSAGNVERDDGKAANRLDKQDADFSVKEDNKANRNRHQS